MSEIVLSSTSPAGLQGMEKSAVNANLGMTTSFTLKRFCQHIDSKRTS